MGALALTYKEQYKTPFLPMMPGHQLAEYNNLESARAVIKKGKTAAVFVEPIQVRYAIEHMQSLERGPPLHMFTPKLAYTPAAFESKQFVVTCFRHMAQALACRTVYMWISLHSSLPALSTHMCAGRGWLYPLHRSVPQGPA